MGLEGQLAGNPAISRSKMKTFMKAPNRFLAFFLCSLGYACMSHAQDVHVRVSPDVKTGIEGVTEFLPVSSTGHLLVAEHLLGLPDDKWEAFTIIIQFGAMTAGPDWRFIENGHEIRIAVTPRFSSNSADAAIVRKTRATAGPSTRPGTPGLAQNDRLVGMRGTERLC